MRRELCGDRRAEGGAGADEPRDRPRLREQKNLALAPAS
jgi:hypothetical protein